MKKYYKVVTSDLKSAYIIDKRFITQYKIGEWVTSPIPVTPLAVFDNLERAKLFKKTIDCYSSLNIFECQISGRTKIPWLLGTQKYFWDNFTLEKIIERAKKHKSYMYLVPKLILPDNTITCKKVKLVKEILY